MDFAMHPRAWQHPVDNSLTIRGLIPQDSGKYTCVATNGIDQDQAEAELVVMGKKIQVP